MPIPTTPRLPLPLLPRRSFKHILTSLPPPLFNYRHASSSSSTAPKPKVLSKPTKFTPPSHPARRPSPPREYPGPPIPPAQKELQKRKKYPNMMPPEGTFMHWFLTNRSIHVWITLSTLFSLAFFTLITDFRRTSPVADLLPAGKSFWTNPLAFVAQGLEVYKLHMAHVSAETAERRRKNLEDVEKRAAYRKAHGLDKKRNGFAGWIGGGGGEEATASSTSVGGSEGVAKAAAAVAVGGQGEANSGDTADAMYTDWEGRKKLVKKWLGIW